MKNTRVEIAYLRPNVYIHPSAYPSDAIPGYLSVVKGVHHYLVAWSPETTYEIKDTESFVQVDCNPEESTEEAPMVPSMTETAAEDHSLYAMTCPIENIHSLVIHPPSLTQWYGSLVINFKEGHSSPPLWFHEDEKNKLASKQAEDHTQVCWGGDEFVDHLERLTRVIRCSEDISLYWVGSTAQENSPDTVTQQEKAMVSSPKTVFDSSHMDPLMTVLKEARWGILEKLSRVTKFSRDTAVSILGHPSSRPIIALLPPDLQSLCNNETVKQTMDDYDSARIYLAKWAADLAAQSEKSTPLERRYRHVGIWGHGGWEEDTALGVFEILNSENDFSIPTHTRTSPITPQQWSSFFDEQGRLQVGEAYLHKSVFCGGLDPSLREEAWLFLTGVYAWSSTATEREVLREEKRNTYVQLKSQWADDEVYQSNPEFQDQRHRINKDVHRTDRTVPMYAKEDMENPDPTMHVGTNKHLEILKDILCTYNIHNKELGYVQGMSDLLSPLYAVIKDESLAFWAFTRFMDRMQSNFFMDQSGMHEQLLTLDGLLQFMDPSLYKHFERTECGNLFFCFRWLLVWFKREFSWEDTLSLWEVLWTDSISEKFHMFVALSILDQHREVIIDYLNNFDEILKYINDLSMNIPLKETLQRAEIIFYQFKQRVEAVETKRDKLHQDKVQRRRSTSKTSFSTTDMGIDHLPVVNDLLKGLLVSKSH
ncbi:rab-GTPase-TBC domain-containing protein [Spinellus fusiger]|nr:rab-GTPase-TBC domain-containing protein [Spinellus fusiger]